LSTVRLNKLLATRGVGARRKCDTLIESGVVRVNGKVVTAPGERVTPGHDKITVNGQPLPEHVRHRYYMLHKPVGMITTLHDPEGRATIRDVLPQGGRLYPVGRLDADTSGLLIVTNDGDLAHHLMHPRYGLTKYYRVLVDREPTDLQIKRLTEGVEFEPGVRSAPALVRRRDPTHRGAVIEISIHEGRHRQVRKMCEAVGLGVIGLHRWAYGPLKLGELDRGMTRELSESEVEALRAISARVLPRKWGSGQERTKMSARERARKMERRARAAEMPPAPLSAPARASAPSARPPRERFASSRASAPSTRPPRERFASPRASAPSTRPPRERFASPRASAPSTRPPRERFASPRSRGDDSISARPRREGVWSPRPRREGSGPPSPFASPRPRSAGRPTQRGGPRPAGRGAPKRAAWGAPRGSRPGAPATAPRERGSFRTARPPARSTSRTSARPPSRTSGAVAGRSLGRPQGRAPMGPDAQRRARNRPPGRSSGPPRRTARPSGGASGRPAGARRNPRSR
jgi:23S rRNA pseudouridine2605 synthase